MDIKQLDQLAKQCMEMPKHLPAYKQAYYIASRGLYQQYDKGEVTLAQARAEKKQVMETYRNGELEWNYFIKLHDVLDKLRQLQQEGFNSVVEFEIMDILNDLLH